MLGEGKKIAFGLLALHRLHTTLAEQAKALSNKPLHTKTSSTSAGNYRREYTCHRKATVLTPHNKTRKRQAVRMPCQRPLTVRIF